MNNISCENCSTSISKRAVSCPSCGHPNKKHDHLSGSQVFSSLIFAAGVFWFMSGGFNDFTNKNLNNIYDNVAIDAVKKYTIAKNSGTNMDKCVAAGLVVASYLQAKDENNYQIWQKIKKADCDKAGLNF